jgi:hypothetical protein
MHIRRFLLQNCRTSLKRHKTLNILSFKAIMENRKEDHACILNYFDNRINEASAEMQFINNK